MSPYYIPEQTGDSPFGNPGSQAGLNSGGGTQVQLDNTGQQPIPGQGGGGGGNGYNNFGPSGGTNYAGLAAGAAGMIGDTIAQAHAKLNLPQFSSALQYSNGRPSYSGDQWNSASNIRVRPAGLTESNWQKLITDTTKGFGQGFSSGGLIGGYVGGSIGTFSNSAGPVGNIHRNEQRQKDNAVGLARAYQQNYNNANRAADQLENAQSDYQRRLSNNRRFQNNLYSLPNDYR